MLLDLIGRTNTYFARPDYNPALLEPIAEWITRMLVMFGLGEGCISGGGIGWGKVGEEADGGDVSFSGIF